MKETFRPIVIASLIAAAVNQVLYFVATGFFEVSFTLTTPATMPIPFFAPALLSIGQGIVGGFIVAWIASSTRSPKNVWLSISLIALALSFVLPLGGIESQTAALWLIAMHAISGALIIPMVRSVLPATKEASAS
jgi:hypothetical protein